MGTLSRSHHIDIELLILYFHDMPSFTWVAHRSSGESQGGVTIPILKHGLASLQYISGATGVPGLQPCLQVINQIIAQLEACFVILRVRRLP